MTRHSSAAATRVAWANRGRRTERRPRRQADGATGRKPAVRFVVTVAVVAALLLILGIRQAGITAVAYEIDATKRELAEARSELESLEAQLAQLEAPDRVEEGALAMGMTDAADVRLAAVHRLAPEPAEAPEGTTSVVLLPPAPGDGERPDVAVDPRGLTEQIGELLLGWLSGGRAEAETIH